MFEIKELEFLRDVLKDTESQDDTTLGLIDKIESILDCSKDDLNKCLWNFYWDYGREGEVTGLFKATKEEVEKAIGKEVYFGEILGKHSEVFGTIEEGEITLVSDDPVYVMSTTESGYNPLEYLRYYCKECGTYCIADDYDVEKDMCYRCEKRKG